ncbi:MAG: hypothetical protein LQ344_003369 [Seirophora lacunosa]|nr:MAG: hypothetical protein LQ344_003369 [Seirophora lacunosa]
MPPIPPNDQALPPLTSTPPPDILSSPEHAPQATDPPPSSTIAPRTLRIGTRASPLALAQVSLFTSILASLHPALPTQTIPISVAGDRDKTTDLHTLAQMGKSLWTEEMEVLLLKGEIDCIVHSLKDVPTKVVEGCEVVVVGERGERRDCVVFPLRDGVNEGEEKEAFVAVEGGADGTTTAPATSTPPSSLSPPSPPEKPKTSPRPTSTSAKPSHRTLSSLPPSSVVGTSSIRRSAMIRRRHPHLRIQDIRGNVGTRLRKLDDPTLGFDCLILAGAGIQRVGLGHRVSEWLGPDINSLTPQPRGDEKGEVAEDLQSRADGAILHAVGQGAIGLEVRAGDAWLRDLLLAPARDDGTRRGRGVVVHRTSWECQAERSLLRTLEGGCSVPVGVYSVWEEDEESVEAAGGDEATTTTTARGRGGGHDDDDDDDATFPTATATAPPSADPAMRAGSLLMLASVTAVDGTECVAAARRQWVGSDAQADEAGWELARVLVQRGAEKILKEIGLNRGMVERGDGA